MRSVFLSIGRSRGGKGRTGGASLEITGFSGITVGAIGSSGGFTLASTALITSGLDEPTGWATRIRRRRLASSLVSKEASGSETIVGSDEDCVAKMASMSSSFFLY